MTKPFTGPLDSFLQSVIVAPDAPFAFADLFTFTTAQTGYTLRYTNTDADVVYDDGSGPQTWSAGGPRVQGLKSKLTAGLDVDRQQITIIARPVDLLGAQTFLGALADGAFDGATVVRTRVFMAALGQPPIGGVVMFKGRVSTVDQVGRTAAKLSIASDLVILDNDMPKNLYQASCLHVLYDAGCTRNRASFALAGTVGAGSTAVQILWSGFLATHVQGYLIFTGGLNAGIRGTVKAVVPGVSATISYPFPEPPSTGDAFTVYEGCAHTQAACNNQFNNLINYRAFNYVPPVTMGI